MPRSLHSVCRNCWKAEMHWAGVALIAVWSHSCWSTFKLYLVCNWAMLAWAISPNTVVSVNEADSIKMCLKIVKWCQIRWDGLAVSCKTVRIAWGRSWVPLGGYVLCVPARESHPDGLQPPSSSQAGCAHRGRGTEAKTNTAASANERRVAGWDWGGDVGRLRSATPLERAGCFPPVLGEHRWEHPGDRSLLMGPMGRGGQELAQQGCHHVPVMFQVQHVLYHRELGSSVWMVKCLANVRGFR